MKIVLFILWTCVDVRMLHVVAGGWIFCNILIYLMMVGGCIIHNMYIKIHNLCELRINVGRETIFEMYFVQGVFLYRRKKTQFETFVPKIE